MARIQLKPSDNRKHDILRWKSIQGSYIGQLISWKDGSWTNASSNCNVQKDFIKANLKYPKGTTLFVHPKAFDVHVSNAILTRGGYEESNIKILSSYLSKYKHSVFIDIGANIGVYSISLASLGHTVISIECLQSNVDRLCASMRYSKDRPLHMTIIVNAASSMNTKVGIHKWKGDMGGTYVNSDKNNTDLIIDTVKLDDLLDIFDISDAILKIDVEKSEDEVLKGSYDFFKKVKVHAVQLEFNKYVYLESGKFIVDFLDLYGLKPQVPANLRNDYKSWTSQNILFLREYN